MLLSKLKGSFSGAFFYAIVYIYKKEILMKNNMWVDPYEGTCEGTTVYIAGWERETKVLGPDGKPYIIIQPKQPLGFDLTRSSKDA
jgi:hypothetical protein